MATVIRVPRVKRVPDPAATRARKRQFRESNPRSVKQSNIKRYYGITHAQYDAMLAEQNGVCAICKQPERVVRHGRICALAVDHDHATGVIRGLLCNDCNLLLGRAKDSQKILRAALAYLKRVENVCL